MAAGSFVVTSEIASPLARKTDRLIHIIQTTKGYVAALNFMDNASAMPRMTAWACSQIALEHRAEPVHQHGREQCLLWLSGRHSVNCAFLALAIQAGVTTAITDPIRLSSSIKAIDLLLGRDSNSMRYLKYFRATEKLRAQEVAVRV